MVNGWLLIAKQIRKNPGFPVRKRIESELVDAQQFGELAAPDRRARGERDQSPCEDRPSSNVSPRATDHVSDVEPVAVDWFGNRF
jgi:hypothetical protein